MGLFDAFKKKAEDATEGHGDKVEEGIDKAAETGKDKFGHEEQIDTAAEKGKEVFGDSEDESGRS